MKKLLIVLAVLVAPLAAAQETYSISASAGQVSDLTAIVTGANLATCRLWVPATPACTQAQACTAANAPGGASCTAAQARGVNARIFPQTQAGREEFVTFQIAAPNFISMKATLPQQTRPAYCTWFNLQAQGTQDSECSKIGLSAGCQCPLQ